MVSRNLEFRILTNFSGNEIVLTKQQPKKNHRAVVSRGAWGTLAPPEFRSSVTLFQPEGANYAHHITVSTPGFGNLTTALIFQP